MVADNRKNDVFFMRLHLNSTLTAIAHIFKTGFNITIIAQLKAETKFSFTNNCFYDSLGNRTDVNNDTPTTYLRNNLNQYTSVGGTNYSYDNNGNLTDDGLFKYYYDCENRLTDVNDQSDTAVASYSYDYLGRRVSKTVYGSPDVTTKYCYDGGQVIAEYDGSDNLLRKFVYGPGIDEPICMIDVDGGNVVYYYHFDGLGSVAALSDVNNVIVESYSYDVFGAPTIYDVNATEISQSAIGNPYMFTARRADDETALYYYRARYYAFDIGRFLQTDPIGYLGGLNLYTYCGNNPLIFIDPFGLDKETKYEELKDLIKRYKERMREARGKGLVPYKMCIDWAQQTVDWELDTEHYQLRVAHGRKEGLGFGPPRTLKPGEDARDVTEGYVEVVDVDTGEVVVTLDPWMPPLGPLDYHCPSINWVWWGSGRPGNSPGITPGEFWRMGP